MRQRRLKDLDGKLSEYSEGIKINPKIMKGRWQEMFAEEQPLYMELGCGKGQFILAQAAAHPERNFVAIEGNRSVMLRALQKAARTLKETDGSFAADPALAMLAEQGDASAESPWSTDADDCVYVAADNLIFANMYLRSVTDCFDEGELSGIYLNFSDPWPKKRHAKRRLTHKRYLDGYSTVLKKDSCLEFKTDNEGLFRFSVEEFRQCGMTQLEYTEDLHSTAGNQVGKEAETECREESDSDNIYESARFMTEYEQKFSSMGNPIYYCKVKF